MELCIWYVIMRKDVTICIGTVGYPTFERCHRSVVKVAENNKSKTVSVKKARSIIFNHKPGDMKI